jgi:Domain of unknown function (DUF5915)
MLRKEAGLAVADRIRLSVAADADQRAVLEEHEVYIRGETLAVALARAEPTGVAQAPRLGDCLSATDRRTSPFHR